MSVALEQLRADQVRSAVLWTLSHYPRGEAFYVSTGWRRHGATRAEESQVRCDLDLPVARPLSTCR